MCRFIAVLSPKPISLEPYLEMLKEQARNGKRNPHPDGFGYWILGDKEWYYRSASPVWEFVGSLPKGRVAMLHARKRGNRGAPVSITNVHPFLCKNSVFMHNGFIDIPPRDDACGATDSESFFLTLLEMGIEEGVKDVIKRFPIVSANFVMWHQGRMIIFRYARKMEDYFTIWFKKGETLVISTEGGGEGWVEVKNGEMWIIDKNLEFEIRCIFPEMCR